MLLRIAEAERSAHMALSEDFLKTLAASSSADDLRAAIEAVGIELSDEALDDIAGGKTLLEVLKDHANSPEEFERIVSALQHQYRSEPFLF